MAAADKCLYTVKCLIERRERDPSGEEEEEEAIVKNCFTVAARRE